MNIRPNIRNSIINAWADCINIDYRSQKINSERSLQASMWAHLYSHLPKNRRLFIEPSISIKINDKTKNIYPDIAICNSKEVIAIIELKYTPRTKANFKKDIESLSTLAIHKSNISLSNTRFRGIRSDDKEYKFSSKILFIWAGIHDGKDLSNNKVFAANHQALKGSYLQLQAATSHGSDPNVFNVRY